MDYTLTSNQGPVHKSEVIVIPTSVTQTFENDYMKLSAPSGWKISPVNKTSNVGTCVNKTNCTYKTKTEVDPSAVNITKGNYILYINTRAKQTSGIIGGRLGEILIGAPSFGAVIKDYSSANSCANLIEGN